jgi:ABC-type siderophore export system fused ATPase/permease subunit
MDIRTALLTVLDQVDYTVGNCGLADPVSAALPKNIIALAREALVKDEWSDEEKPVIRTLEEIKKKVHQLDNYPRVEKLINKGKNFIVIAEGEPYFIKAYGMIREQETKQGTWTTEDERIYQEAILRILKRL